MSRDFWRGLPTAGYIPGPADNDLQYDPGEQSSAQAEEKSSQPEEKQEPEPKQKEESKQESKSEESSPAPQGEAETIKVPQMAESISEGTLKTWNKKVGDHVEADEEIASIETDKVTHHFMSFLISALTSGRGLCRSTSRSTLLRLVQLPKST